MQIQKLFKSLIPSKLSGPIEDKGNVVMVVDVSVEDSRKAFMNLDRARCHIDFNIPSQRHSFFIQGWHWFRDSTIQSVKIILSDGNYIDVTEQISRFTRQDVVSYIRQANLGHESNARGFLLYVGNLAVQQVNLIRFELSNNDIYEFDLNGNASLLDPIVAIKSILAQYPHFSSHPKKVCEMVGSIINDLNNSLNSITVEPQMHIIGQIPEDPEVSIIVPIYGTLEFMEHQFLQFHKDTDFKKNELILVIDDPCLATSAPIIATELALHYDINLKLVLLPINTGFSRANNIGSQFAQGKYLLLLNSDVIPNSKGWINKMLEFYKSKVDIGALGVKLLYENDSLQHAGGYFSRDPISLNQNIWFNMHYFKGMHKDIASANVDKIVPFVTAACLLIDKEKFDSVSGFTDDYVIANYEDSDLCLKLYEKGLMNWYYSGVEMYHLEGMTQNKPENSWLKNAIDYNCWLHTKKWHKQMDDTMRVKS